MELRIGNLPPGTTEDDVREVLHQLRDIKTIRITDEGDADNVVAWVDIEGTRAGLQALAKKVNGTMWKERRISAYAAGFVK